MLANLNDVMPIAERTGACLPAFDVAGGQPDVLLGVLRTCEAAGCPTVLLVYAPAAEGYLGLDALAHLVSFHAARADVPVVLHLDHGASEEVVAAALDAGLRSVMFDGSRCPLDENIARTRAMAELAHARGATIEGELGRIGREQSDDEPPGALTDPDEAARFVRETGVDLLAPAVGNAHGFYREEPRLRFELIAQIAASVGVPLSLHGGTGIPLADVRRAGELGMRKVNIASQLHKDFSDAIRDSAVEVEAKRFSWHMALRAGREAVAATVERAIKGLGAEGLV